MTTRSVPFRCEDDFAHSPDIDKGWAFVVMIASCLSLTLTLGLSYCTAMFYTIFLDEFEESPVLTAWTANLNCFIFFMIGELSNGVVAVVGLRIAISIGAVLSALGFIICSFAKNLYTVIVAYGVICGIGFSFGYFPVFEIIASYFSKYRVIAFGLCLTGGGLGHFLYPALLQFLMDIYHWRGAFIILAVISMNLFVIAAVFMPPRVVKPMGSDQEATNLTTPRKTSNNRILAAFKRLLDNLLMFKQSRWSLFCISYMCTYIGVGGFCTHISNYARILGYDSHDSSNLVSFLGIGSLTGRLAVGFIGKVKKVHIVGLYLSLSTMLGVIIVAISFAHTFLGLSICSVLVGLSTGSSGLFPEVIIHIVGIKYLSTGVSYGAFASAIGIIAGGSIAASIYEIDPSYRWSFIIVGIIAFVGGLLNLPSWYTIDNGSIKQRKSADAISSATHNIHLNETVS